MVFRNDFSRERGPLSGLTPSVPLTAPVLFPDRLSPYPYDPVRAGQLWRAAGGGGSRPLRLATLAPWEDVARQVAAQLTGALGLQVDVDVLDAERERDARRRLAAKDGPQALYAVNRHVHFRPYRNTFELADTSVDRQHWSRQR